MMRRGGPKGRRAALFIRLYVLTAVRFSLSVVRFPVRFPRRSIKRADLSYTGSMKTILFTGGGSAGHVVPNLALMRELRYTYALSYMGTGGIEQRLVTDAGYPFLRVDCPKFRRSLCLENCKIPYRLHCAKRAALRALSENRPDLVFSKGGFASYPAVWAAHKLGVPILTHESDLTPGLCTRLIAKKCAYVLTSFEETASKFSNGKYVGSPIRKELFSCDKQRAMHKFGLPVRRPVLLVFGGGSGSKALNDAVAAALPDLLETFSVLHIAGDAAAEKTVQENGKCYLLKRYEPDMGSAYACADVVLSRAGSNTVFELMALKKRAVLVPLAHATRGDQLANATYFEKQGLVSVLREEELARLPAAVKETLEDARLGDALAASQFSSATGEIVKLIREFVDDAGGASE